MPSRFRRIVGLLAIAALGVPAATAARGANPVYFSGTAEYYQVIDTHVTWPTARDAAATTSYLGVPGRLVTINSAAENDFVESILTMANDSFWIGGYQDRNSPNYAEPSGGWRWLTDEPFTYINWRPFPLEPSNGGGNEDFLEILRTTEGYWNDLAVDSILSGGYVIEYATPVPEPGSLALAVLGAGAFLLRPRRSLHRAEA
jgi:hypothetical protein